MDYVYLGRTALRVSPLCLGTMNFGPKTPEADAFKIMDRALDEGINFFDTANVYGQEKGRGATEEIIGHWFTQGGGRREKVVLATKVYGRFSDWPNDGDLSAVHIRQAVEDSLRRLQTDHIELYQMHHIDRHAPWEEVWQAMVTLVQQGKVVYVGSSNFAGWHIAQAQAAAEKRNFLGLVSEQSLYNLMERRVELEVLPACEHNGLAVIPWSPLNRGALGGALQKAKDGRRSADHVQGLIEKHQDQLEQYEAVCQEWGETPADVALAWLLTRPAVTAPIIGPRTMEQFDGNLHALEIELSEEQLAKLDEIWPGPGPAPEAYAW